MVIVEMIDQVAKEAAKAAIQDSARVLADEVACRLFASGAMDGAIIQAIFDRKPRADLSKSGFEMAFHYFISKHWPDVTPPEAQTMLWDSHEAAYGDKEYEWSAAVAHDLALDYVTQFGEGAPGV